MLGLTLREEFRARRLKTTQIELANDAKTGAIQLAAGVPTGGADAHDDGTAKGEFDDSASA